MLHAERWLLVAASSLAFGGCAARVEGEEAQGRVGQAIQPIVGGVASGSDQDAVVVLARFENGARASLCTATLVAANLALTARHCVSATDPAAACGADGEPVVGALLHGDRTPATLAVFSARGGVAPDTTSDAAASAHGKALVVDDAPSICNHDLAFVILDAPIAAPIAPIRLGPTAPSEALTAVGFGLTEAGKLPSSRMQRGGLSLVGIGPMPYPDDARYGVGSHELLVGESACAGDSGSPLFGHAVVADPSTSATPGAVVGVASRAGNGQPHDPTNAASTCVGSSAHAVYAELGAVTALVTRAFQEAGATPWLEGQPDPRSVKKDPTTGSSGGGADRGTRSPAPAAMMDPAPRLGGGGASSASDDGGGGCSTSGSPVRGAVEDALGIVALVLLVLRVRSARRKRTASARAGDGGERVPYVDLGMRESFASLSDER